MKKERILEADAVRLICSLGIIIFHYACSSNADMPALIRNANGNWGHVLVVMFFMLSGAMLYYNYSEIRSVKEFYFKRWKSIFPVFYLMYGFFFFTSILEYKKFFFYSPEVEPWKLILSFVGLDGYLNFGMLEIPTYYLIGDWFLGAIILLYAVYPLLIKLVKRFDIIVTAVFLGGFIAVVLTGWYDSWRQRAFITCLFSFTLGIMYMKYRHIFGHYITAIISGICALALCFITLPLDRIFVQEFMGICFFIALMYAGKIIMKIKKAARIISPLAALTFPVFLLQHKFIIILFNSFNPGKLIKALALMIICIVLIFLFSKAADILAKAITSRK